MCDLKDFRFILVLFVVLVTVQTQAVDSVSEPDERAKKIAVTVASTSTAHSGGYPEAAKTSAAAEMHLITYYNELNLVPLRESVAFLKNPEIIKDINPDDHKYLKFLEQKLACYEASQKQLMLLGKLCSDSVDAQPAKTRDYNKLFGVPSGMRAKFIESYGRPLLSLYDRTVLAYGVTKLDKVLKRRLVPSADVLRQEWEIAEQDQLKKTLVAAIAAADGAGFMGDYTRRIPLRRTQAFDFGKAGGLVDRAIVRPMAQRPVGPLLGIIIESPPVAEEFGGHSYAGYTDRK